MLVSMCSPVTFNQRQSHPANSNISFTSTHFRMRPTDALAILENAFGHGTTPPDCAENVFKALSFLTHLSRKLVEGRAIRPANNAAAALNEVCSALRNEKLAVPKQSRPKTKH